MTPPKPNHQAFPFQKIVDEDSQSIFVGDAMQRLGRLESQMVQILPVLGRVDEAVSGLTNSLDDIKTDVKDMVSGFTAFKFETATYGTRLSELETQTNRYDTQKLEELERARLKAEAILEQDRVKAEAVLNEASNHRRDRRNRILSIVGTAIASFTVTLIVTWLKLK